MPTLIRWRDGQAVLAEDPFTVVDDDQPMPRGDVLISLGRFEAEGDRLLSEGRHVGVRVEADEAVEEDEGASGAEVNDARGDFATFQTAKVERGWRGGRRGVGGGVDWRGGHEDEDSGGVLGRSYVRRCREIVWEVSRA